MSCLWKIISNIGMPVRMMNRHVVVIGFLFIFCSSLNAQTTIGLTTPTNPTTVCQSTVVGISGTSNDPNALFVKWVRVTNGTITATGPVVATTPDGSGNFNYSFNFNAAVLASAQTTHVFTMIFGPTSNDVDFETIPPAFTTSNSLTITVNPNPTATLTALGGITSACQNASSPTVNITGVIGTAPFTFTYSITDPSSAVTNHTVVSNLSGTAQLTVPTSVATGAYTYQLLTIQDASSTACSNASTATLTMTISPLPTATINSSSLTACQSTTAPTVTITAAGATAPYTVTYELLTNGVSGGNQTIITNGAGVATITPPITTAATLTYQLISVQSSVTNCVNSQNSSVTITVNPKPVFQSLAPFPPSICYGAGFLNVTLTYSVTPDEYKITWDPIATAANFVDVPYTTLPAGGGIAVIVPTNAAAGATFTGTLTVRTAAGCESDPGTAPFTINALPVPSISANGSGLTFCVGGTTDLTASGGTTYAWTGGPNVATFSNITTGGTYTVTVTNAAGCNAVTSTTVTVNALPVPSITANGSGLTFCVGGTTDLTASGGTTYAWTGGPNAATFTNITTGGTYTVTVTNAAGCNAVTSTTVTVNALPVPSITASGSGLTFCVGGTTNLTASGGTTYAWTGGPNAATFSNITTGGTYTVTVTNAAGCNAVTSTTVTVNALPVPSITASGSGLTFCVGGTTNLTASGGTTYAWTGGPNAATFSNITTGGTYTVTVTNAAGCNAVTSTTVTVNALPVPSITANGSGLTFCVGGTTDLTASGGTTYAWTGGPNAATFSNITTGGTYTVTVTNAAGCNAVTSTTVTVNALPVPSITANGSGLTFCVGGTTDLTASGGTTYAWTGGPNAATFSNITTGGTYTVTVTNAAGCNAVTSTTVTVNALPVPSITANGSGLTFCVGGTTDLTASGGTTYAWTGGPNAATFSNITTGGTYSVTVTNLAGCTVVTSTVVTVNALPTPVINASGPLTFCAGNSVNLTAGGGNSYAWSNGTNTALTNITTSGTFSVTVTNAAGCNAITSTTVIVNALPIPGITAGGPLTFCTGNSVNLTASGGNTYAWTNGINTAVTNIVSSGTYSVTVTNAAGCTAVASRTVTVNPLPTPVINASGPLTFCAGNSVNLTASGGTNYVWSNASPSASITNITTSGTYSVTVTDANNCSATSAPVTITVNTNPTVTITNPAAVCSPGTIDLTAASIKAGSTAGLNFSYWSNAVGTTTLSTPFAIGTTGTYYIRGTNTVTNCSTIQPVVVNINPQAVMQINTPLAVCSPQTVDLTAAAITSGSAAGLSYTYFTNAAATTSLSNANGVNASGVYYIKGTPASGCSAVVPVTVTINPLPTLVINNPAAVCSPQTINLNAATITAGSSTGLSFAYFSNAALTTPITNAQTVNNSGIFYIRATDASTGCVRALPVTVQINAAPQGVLQTPATNIICENGSVTLNASGGNSYQWLLNQQPITGANASTYNATAAGNYAVRFISAQNCEAVSSNTIQLELLNKPTVQFTLTNACAGVPTSFNNTSLTSASGGINWLWDFGDGSSSNQFSPAHMYTNAGTYAVRLTATSPVCNNFSETSLVTYRVQSALPAIRYKDVDVLKDIPATVTARAIGTSFLWLPATGVNNNRIASPSIRVSTTTEYTVAITNDIGCTTTDTVLLKVIPGVDIYVPQGFTPNNDGQNDRLYPILVGMRQLNYFRVFNRWGHMIFTTKESSAQSGWNGLYLGVMQPMGTYTWMAEAVDLQGNVVRKTGTVLLLQ